MSKTIISFLLYFAALTVLIDAEIEALSKCGGTNDLLYNESGICVNCPADMPEALAKCSEVHGRLIREGASEEDASTKDNDGPLIITFDDKTNERRVFKL